MRLSSFFISLLGGASITAAAPSPAETPKQLNDGEPSTSTSDSRTHSTSGTTLSGKRANWALIGWSGLGCTGKLAFGYAGSATTACTNTNFARSVGLQNEWPLSPVSFANLGWGSLTNLQYVSQLGANYWCYNGDVGSFQARRLVED